MLGACDPPVRRTLSDDTLTIHAMDQHALEELLHATETHTHADRSGSQDGDFFHFFKGKTVLNRLKPPNGVTS